MISIQWWKCSFDVGVRAQFSRVRMQEVQVDGDVAALGAHDARRVRGVTQQRGVLGQRVAGALALRLALALAPRRRAGAAGPRSDALRLRLYFYRAARAHLWNTSNILYIQFYFVFILELHPFYWLRVTWHCDKLCRIHPREEKNSILCICLRL